MATVTRVASLQLVLATMVAIGAAAMAGFAAAQAAMMGGGCVLAGTLAYACGQRMIPGQGAARLMWGHMAGEAAKVVVTLVLLAVLLANDPGRGLASLSGFGAALLAYPLAIFWLNK
jgi:F0F1-type ATP synthase assembly protein I